MSLATYNIIAPSPWSAGDLVTRNLPSKTGFYPDPDIAAFQPTTFYMIGSAPISNIPAGRVITSDISIQPINVYNGYTSIVPMFYPQVLHTQNKYVGTNIDIQPIPVSITSTQKGTSGLTVSIWREDPYPLEDAPGLPES